MSLNHNAFPIRTNPKPQRGFELVVDLWAARLPGMFGFAEHCWLVIWRGGSANRWEVWQDPDFGGQSWGHLHLNLFGPTAGMRDKQAYWMRRWVDESAVAIAERAESSPQSYPWRDRYHYVPGPNSNTFIQWCLGREHQLGWRSVGRGFTRFA